MAQGLLQLRLKRLEHRLTEPIEVASAGMLAVEGMSPSREALRLLQREGLDMSTHMARALTDDMIRAADLILAMEQVHLEDILRRVPEARGKVSLLKAFGLPSSGGAHHADIPDPIGKTTEIYEDCFSVIQAAVDRVAQSLVGSGKQPQA